jgi:hypothetical protein
MTGTASNLDGEPNLQFDGETLYQQPPGVTIANLPFGGITSNISSVILTSVNKYPTLERFTGEVIYGENIGGPTITRGEVCYWSYDAANGFGFRATDISVIQSTFMLGLALEDVAGGGFGQFLLKGFVSIPANFIDLGSGGSDGEPLYLTNTPPGYLSSAGRWGGTPGAHYYRCIGYLVAQIGSVGGSAANHVIRFDPSTDYIL